MIYSAVVIGLWGYLLTVFFLYYYRQYRQLPSRKFFSLKVLGVPVATVLVVVIPLLIINIRGESYVNDPLQKIEMGDEEGDVLKVLEAREELLREDSLNIDHHFEYVKLAGGLRANQHLEELKEWYLYFKQSREEEVADIAYLMEGFIDFYSDHPIRYWATFDKVENDSLKYLNFGYGLVYYMGGEFNQAEEFFKKELSYGGYGLETVSYLVEIYEFYGQNDKLRQLTYDPLTYPYLNPNYKMRIYFEDGAWFHYFREAIERHKVHLNLFGFLGALLASLVWIWYLRSLDVFEPEKWRNIIIVFLMGVLSVLLVYPLSDTMEYHLGFTYGNGWWNDLIYATFAIGLVEEVVKFVPWFLFLRFTKAFNEPFDFIIYSALSAAGFAFAENLIYFQEADLHIIFIRATYCAVGHMFWSSMIGYSFILYKYRFKHARNKFYIIPLAFIIAAVSHGIYDFFLFKNIGTLSILFFLGSLHLFVVFQNNALNMSSHFNYQIRLNVRRIGINLIFGLLAVFMYQYLVIGLRYGNDDANAMVRFSALSVSFMLAYLTYTFTQLRIARGAWIKIKMPDWVTMGSQVFGGFAASNPKKKIKRKVEDLSGMQLRFFAPKENPFVGTQLPVTGTLKQKITISGSDDWYVTELDRPVVVNDCLRDWVVVRHKTELQSLKKDKIQVYFLMIPTAATLEKEVLLTRDFFFTGKVYSRPIS